MRILRTIVSVAGILLLLVIYWVASEVHYFRSISPEGIVTFKDYLGRFGDPRFVDEFQRNGQSCYVITGHGPAFWSLAAPSDPPSYVFDASDKFVEWCPDRGETTTDYNRRWPRSEACRLDVQVFKQRYAGQYISE